MNRHIYRADALMLCGMLVAQLVPTYRQRRLGRARAQPQPTTGC